MGTGTGAAPRTGNQFQFTKDGKFLRNRLAATVIVDATRDQAVELALLTNSPFPAGTIPLGNIRAHAGGESGEIAFDSGAGAVSFSVQADAETGFGVYPTSTDLIRALDPQRGLLEGLHLVDQGVSRFVVLHWNYRLGASMQGTVAAAPGLGITFGADGAHSAFFATIRGFAAEPNARDAVERTISSWKLPAQVKSIDDIEPGTWIVTEVDGEFNAKLGVQYGFDQTWLRNVNLQGLSGEVGLKVEAAVNATLGFHTAGKYLMAVARESTHPDQQLVRVRLYKMAKKGLDFALNAGVDLTPQLDKFLPEQFDTFLSGLFGVHGPQLVADLNDFTGWLDGTKSIPDYLGGFVSHYIASSLEGFAGDKAVEARTRIQKFIDQWNALPHTASTLLWTQIQKGGKEAEEFETRLRTLAAAGDGEIRSLLTTALSTPAFFLTPAGRWLEALQPGSLLDAVNNVDTLASLRTQTQSAVAALGSQVLQELAAYAGKSLGLDTIQRTLDMATFDTLEKWMQQKITNFVGKAVDASGLASIQQSIRILRGKAAELYTAARQALQGKYTAALHSTYASSTTKDVLLDVTFDFSMDPGLGPFLTSAIHGDFSDILVRQRNGITIGEGKLTHGIRRNSHIQIVLPHFESTIDHINESLASMKVREDGGRVFLYELTAKDEIIARRKSAGCLMVTGKIPLPAGGKVRSFVDEGSLDHQMTFTYKLRQAFPDMRTAQLEQHIEPLLSAYFPAAFGGTPAPGKASLREWVSDLDVFADEVEERASNVSNGRNVLGKTLLSLEVSVPGTAVAAWLKAPASPLAPEYMEMSRRVQQILRRLVPFCYFQNPRHYAETPVAASLLAYQSLPVTTSIRTGGNTLAINTEEDVYWDFRDAREREAILLRRPANGSPSTADMLSRRMFQVQMLLQDNPNLRKHAAFYASDQLGKMLGQALGDKNLLPALLFVEAEVIEHAREAGLAMAKLASAAGTDPEKALDGLAEFGSKVTEAFHSSLGSLFDSDHAALREFSSVVFLEAAQAFDPALAALKPSARLNIALLRSSAGEKVLADFIDGVEPDATLIAIQQPIVGLPA